jgi:hypothetical protein
MNSARLTPAIAAPIDWEISPREYQSSDAAIRISRTNSFGDSRSAEGALPGTSNVILAIIPAAAAGYRAGCCKETVGGCTLNRGAEAPREVLPIVSRLSADV